MMLGTAGFWEEEAEAPLLQRNEGFLRREDWEEKVLPRTRKWPELVLAKPRGPEEEEWPAVEAISEENQRIILRDAERTFLGETRRQQMQKVLTAVIDRFGDYAQGLGYTAGFLLLTQDERTTVALLTELNERYVPGYWKHEAVGFATDALVFEELLRRVRPGVAAHLQQRHILPETYCQRWFVGLGIHVLPFELLFAFFDAFLAHGQRFLFQFGLSVVDHLHEEILRTKDAASLYALLRLDPTHRAIRPAVLRSIIDRATEFSAAVEAADLAQLRHEAYETKLRPRLEAARRSFEASKHNQENHDDHEEDDEDDEDDEEGFECQVCSEMSPEIFCKDCQLLLCGVCHEENRGTHSSSHQTDEDWEEAAKLTHMMAKAKISND